MDINMTLMPEGYRPRLVDEQIEHYLRLFGAVCVEGPKYCGKTWASRSHSSSAYMVGDPSNNFQNRRFAEMEVTVTLSGEAPHLIDEWQDVPGIWDAVRTEVDKTVSCGRYILTGSSTPRRKGVMHSGAGRIGDLRMRTMSLFESGDSEGRVSLRSMFDGSFQNSFSQGETELRRLADLVVRGGWPQYVGYAPDDAQIAIRSYMDRIVKDASSLDGRRLSEDRMRMLLRSLSRNESTVASARTLIDDMRKYDDEEPDQKTVSTYWDALDRVFMIEDQPAFNPNVRSSVRVGKKPKRHLTDPALAVAAMGLDTGMLLEDLNTLGFLFEALCERDLQIYAQADGGSLSHYRDSDGREIDAVVEMPSGRWGAFEIKLGANQIDAAADNLLSISDYLVEKGVRRPPSVLAVICGKETSAYRRPDGVCVVPITSLRN